MWQDNFDAFTPQQKKVLRHALSGLYDQLRYARQFGQLCEKHNVTDYSTEVIAVFDENFRNGKYDATGIIQAMLDGSKTDAVAADLATFLTDYLQGEIVGYEMMESLDKDPDARADSEIKISVPELRKKLDTVMDDVRTGFPELEADIRQRLSAWRMEMRERKDLGLRHGPEGIA
ncbi:MAG TPA: hypothetical protein DEG44_03925 [Candidatus Kerfeldbacteria bacterium]|nr:hypothetical protein [Candidatus Kerfeldbacteria bacterium]